MSSQFSVEAKERGRGGGSSLKQQSLPGGPTASCGYGTLCWCCYCELPERCQGWGGAVEEKVRWCWWLVLVVVGLWLSVKGSSVLSIVQEYPLGLLSRHSAVVVLTLPPGCVQVQPDLLTNRSQPSSSKQGTISHHCLFRTMLASTQAGRALVVPAIWPFLQAQRAVCLAMVLRGWLLSRSSVTISHVPAASWPSLRRREWRRRMRKQQIAAPVSAHATLSSCILA